MASPKSQMVMIIAQLPGVFLPGFLSQQFLFFSSFFMVFSINLMSSSVRCVLWDNLLFSFVDPYCVQFCSPIHAIATFFGSRFALPGYDLINLQCISYSSCSLWHHFCSLGNSQRLPCIYWISSLICAVSIFLVIGRHMGL